MMAKALQKSVFYKAEPASPLASLIGKASVTRDDVAALRQSELALGLRSRDDAEMIFTIERGAAEKCRAWGDLLVELLTDFVVWDQRPSGVLTEETALWLGDQVGEVPTPACLALLVAIMEDAETVPAWFLPAVRLRASKAFGRDTLQASQQAA